MERCELAYIEARHLHQILVELPFGCCPIERLDHRCCGVRGCWRGANRLPCGELARERGLERRSRALLDGDRRSALRASVGPDRCVARLRYANDEGRARECVESELFPQGLVQCLLLRGAIERLERGQYTFSPHR